MPTIKRIGPHRFFFFSNEGGEPPHVHVETAENAAKFWLNPIGMAWSAGYNSKQLRQLRELISENVQEFEQQWYEHFS